MKASRIAKLIIINMLVFLTLYPLGGAMAVKPNTVTEIYDVVGEPNADCGDFLVLGDSTQTFVITDFYNKDGEIEKTQVHFSTKDGIVYNSEHPERSLPEGPDHAMWYFYPDPDVELPIYYQSGLAFHVNVPGYGIIAINVGRIIMIPDFSKNYWEWEIIWDKGMNDLFNDDLVALCDYLRVP